MKINSNKTTQLAKKIIALIIAINISGIPAALANADSSGFNSFSRNEESFSSSLNSTPVPSDSLTHTIQGLSQNGLNSNNLRTFFQQNIFSYNGTKEAQQFEVVQGHVSLEEFVELLAKMQEDFIRVLIEKPNTKFKVRILEDDREISKELPAKFFLALLRESNLLEYERIQNNPEIQKLLEQSKDARKLIEAQFTDNFDNTGKVTETKGSKNSKIYFAVIRFAGNLITKPVLSLVISSTVLGTAISAGIAFDSLQFVQDVSVQGMMSSFGAALALFGTKYAQWLDHGFPNYGNTEFNVYLRWWILEGAFLTILPIAYFMWGVYPEQSVTSLMIDIWFKTAILSTLSQGLWEIIISKHFKKDAKRYEKIYLDRLEHYKNEGVKSPALALLRDPGILKMKESDLGKLMRTEETSAKRRFYATLAYNSIISVTLASLQATASMQGIEFLTTATNIAFGVYIASAISQMLSFTKNSSSADRISLRKVIWDTAIFIINPVQWFKAASMAAKALPNLFVNKDKLKRSEAAQDTLINVLGKESLTPRGEYCMALFK